MQKECLSCDVLIIGGGLAGLVAALEARERVGRVCIAAKGKVGASGNTIVSGTGVSAFVPGTGDSEELFYQDILRSGKGINDKELAAVLAGNAGRMVRRLGEFGVQFQQTDGKYVRRHSGAPGSWKVQFVKGEKNS